MISFSTWSWYTCTSGRWNNALPGPWVLLFYSIAVKMRQHICKRKTKYLLPSHHVLFIWARVSFLVKIWGQWKIWRILMNCMVFNEGRAYPETSNNHQNRKDVEILTGSVLSAQPSKAGGLLCTNFCLGKAGAVGIALSGWNFENVQALWQVDGAGQVFEVFEVPVCVVCRGAVGFSDSDIHISLWTLITHPVPLPAGTGTMFPPNTCWLHAWLHLNINIIFLPVICALYSRQCCQRSKKSSEQFLVFPSKHSLLGQMFLTHLLSPSERQGQHLLLSGYILNLLLFSFGSSSGHPCFDLDWAGAAALPWFCFPVFL